MSPRIRLALLLVLFVARVSSAATLGPWTLGPTMNGGVSRNGVAGVSGHLYVVTHGGIAEHAVIRPDGSLDPWTNGTATNLRRIYAITVAVGGHLYIAGGLELGGDSTATVEVAAIGPDGALGPWSYTSPMTGARWNHAGAASTERLYILTNYAGSAAVESAGILPDGTLSPWRTETSLNQGRERPAAAVVGAHLYVVGGLPFTTSVERAAIGTDGVLGPWEFVSSNLKARYQVGAASVGPLLFAIGGYNDGEGGFASVEMAVVSAGVLGPWSFTSPMVHMRDNCDATAVGTTLYAIGANALTGQDDRTVEFASVSGISTTTTTTAPEPTTTTTTEPEPTTTTTEPPVTTTSTTSTTTSTLVCVPPDADGDGEVDATDRCPGTPAGAEVDGDGCSLLQFCALFDATTRDGARRCRKADWANDEPTMRGREADCRVNRGGPGPADDECVPTP